MGVGVTMEVNSITISVCIASSVTGLEDGINPQAPTSMLMITLRKKMVLILIFTCHR
jgi:hypothetical protein